MPREATMPQTSDLEFVRAVDSCDLETLTHHDHIRLAWLTLQSESLSNAIDSLRLKFATFAASKGQPMVYHETITWAFTLIMNERIQCGRGGSSWEEFITLNPDIARGRSILDDYYDREKLDSALYRSTFILPKRQQG